MTAVPAWTSLPPPAHPEGTWRSQGYRSARTRSRWAMGTLAFAAVACGLTLLVILQGHDLATRTSQGGYVGIPEADQYRSSAEVALSLFGFAVIFAAIAFLAWLSRTVDNVPPLGGGTPHNSPRYAIGWWFVPIAFLWKPYTVVREAADRLVLPGRTSGRLVLAWWLVSLAGLTINQYSSVLASDTPDPDHLARSLAVNAVGMACLFVGAILGVLVVREIQGRADARAAILDLHTPAGAWPALLVPPSGSPAAGTGGAIPGGLTPSFCPSCGTPRLGSLRYCASCQFDFETYPAPVAVAALAPAEQATTEPATPEPTTVEPATPGPATAAAGWIRDAPAGEADRSRWARLGWSGPFRIAVIGTGILAVLDVLAVVSGAAASPPAALVLGLSVWFFLLWGAAILVNWILHKAGGSR